MANENKDKKDKLLQLVQEAVKKDAELRASFAVGDKFRFIRDRLNALQARVEEAVKEMQEEDQQKIDVLAEDELLVYVYLFNAQGIVFKSWQKMLAPSVFYEHSVNRPIYTEKTHAEAFIRSKPNKQLHGILTIAIKKAEILAVPVGLDPPKDPNGNVIIKVKEGSLRLDRLVSFTHSEHEYIVTPGGEIVLKD